MAATESWRKKKSFLLCIFSPENVLNLLKLAFEILDFRSYILLKNIFSHGQGLKIV